MRVVQVSPFSVIQRSPPVSLPPPEILSDRFLFCRKAHKSGSLPPFYRGGNRRRPQTGHHRLFPANRRSMAAAFPAFLLIYTIAVPTLPKTQKQRPEPLQKSDHDVQQLAIGRLKSKTGEPHRGAQAGRCPFAAVFARFCSAKSLPALREALRPNKANGREGCLQPDQ